MKCKLKVSKSENFKKTFYDIKDSEGVYQCCENKSYYILVIKHKTNNSIVKLFLNKEDGYIEPVEESSWDDYTLIRVADSIDISF